MVSKPPKRQPEPRLSDQEVDRLREAWREVWTSEPFGVVLLLVFASFVFLESAPEQEWATVISVMLQGTTLLVALHAADARPRYQHLARGIVFVALIVSIVAVAGVDEDVSRPFVRLVSMLLVAIAPIAIARSVARSIIRQRRVTLQSVFGVISIYLLTGMLFAYAFAAVAAIGIPDRSPLGPTDDFWFFAQHQADTIQNFVYFSFVTLTTVGYGDLTAAHQFPRTLAIVEALFGQLYLITVLSVFVANLRPRSARQ